MSELVALLDLGSNAARLGACAVTSSLAIDAGLVVDLGGGSLQISELRHGEPREAVSLPLGAVRATSRFLRHDPPSAVEVRALRREVRGLVAGIVPAALDGETLVGLGGTVRTLARMQRAATRRDTPIHGMSLDRASVAAMRERLEGLSLRRRRGVPGLEPERADIIVAGTVIVEELMNLGGHERLTVCGYGVRHGVLVEETFGPMTPR